MIQLKQDTVELIRAELASIPAKYQSPFPSEHHGLGVLREEYVELENEIFFGEKRAYQEFLVSAKPFVDIDKVWKSNIRKEAVQVAAMAIRIIQELT